MFNLKNAAALITSTAIAAGAATAAPTRTSADYGVAAHDSAAQRVLTVTPTTKYLDVTDGETVNIAADGKSFTWHVSTYPGQSGFDLGKIAPEGIDAKGVTVYVAANPTYFGG